MSNLPAKERINKMNCDISDMIKKLGKFHEENIEFLNNFKGSHEIYAGNT